MNSETIKKIYENENGKGEVFAVEDGIGINIIRDYPIDSEFYKDKNKIFIKLGITQEGNRVFYSVSRVKDKSDNGEGSYLVLNNIGQKSKVNNFSSTDHKVFYFENENNRVQYSDRSFTLTDFVDILEENHLRKNRFLYIKLFCVSLCLKSIFFLCDKKYNKYDTIIQKYSSQTSRKIDYSGRKKLDPFLRFFIINKNILWIFSILFLSLLIFLNIKVKESCINDDIIILLILFFLLFSLEMFSLWINRKMSEFLDGYSDSYTKNYPLKKNFIENLFNFIIDTPFILKLKK